MRLLLKSEEVAWSGIMMSVAVLLIVLSSVIETSSLFLLAASSFICGLVQRKFSIKLSVIFAFGTFILGLILAPNKLYCFTFIGFSIYVLVAEYFRKKLNDSYKNGDDSKIKKDRRTSFLVKCIVYHVLLITALVLVNMFTGINIESAASWMNKIADIPILFGTVVFIMAELLWIIFDRAYIFFQDRYAYLLLRENRQ